MSENNGSDAPGNGNGTAENELQKALDQAEKYKNDYLYLRAEFENYKKHAIKERSDLTKFGAERLAKDLLGVLDNFERALQFQVTPENVNQFRQGVEMTEKELKNLLQRHGIAEVPAEGLPFDPAAHEALTNEISDKVAPGHVLRVFQKAYKLHDKLIRPAQVVVAGKAE